MEKLKILKNLVSFRSDESCKSIINYLIQRFKPYSKQVVRIKSKKSNSDCLLVGVNTQIENTEAIILSGHIDTVPADKNYSTCPYTLTIKDNRAYGLGVIDMKCYFSTILENIEELQRLSVPVIIAISSDEETRLEAIEQIIDYLKCKNIKPIFSIIGEPTSLNICSFSRGCYEYMVSVTGKSAHSSNPQNGINACNILAKIINKLELMNDKYEDTTINCGIVSGGTAINIVPDLATLKFDIRSTKKQTIKQILEEIAILFTDLETEYYGANISLQNTLVIPELEKREDEILKEFIAENNLEECEFKAASEAGYFCCLGGTAILFGAGDLTLAHKADEYLDLNKFEKYNNLFMLLMQKLNRCYLNGRFCK